MSRHMKRRPIIEHPLDDCTRCLGTRGGTPGEENIINDRLVCSDCVADLLSGNAELPCPVCYKDLSKHKWVPWDVMYEEMGIGNIRAFCMDDKHYDMVLIVHCQDDNPMSEEDMLEIST